MSAQKNSRIHCWIYRSPHQDQMYLYVKRKDDFDSLPSELMQHFGHPGLVMELTLHAGRTLAREDVCRVMHNIEEQGYHLQMPPKIDAVLNTGE